MHRRKIALAPPRPVHRKRRRLALAAERQARRRKRSITAGLSRPERSARAAALPLIAIVLLPLGLWAAIWSAIASLASAVQG